MQMVTFVQYLCNQCNKSQNIRFTDEMRSSFITGDPNGLSLFSHIHLCENGIAGVNNLNIDHNLHVRGYNFVELPRYEVKKKSMVPGAPKIQKSSNSVIITHIFDKNDLNLVFNFSKFGYNVQIGNFNPETREPIEKLKSEKGSVLLQVFESEVKYTSQVQKWLRIFLENLDFIVPSRLGLFIEILQFILEEKNQYPSEMDRKIIKSILVSYDIFMEFKGDMHYSTLTHVYGEENGTLMVGCVDALKEDPLTSLHELVQKFKKNIVKILFALLILEIHGVIEIHSPDIMDVDFDLDSLLET
ncbi:MAG: hypothetical protein INQ03_09475 [Candidatus Heimdallarchaeota archaeon]|nr:hypothetical protein [Candidatus Heimdallarchaeota archaeon]